MEEYIKKFALVAKLEEQIEFGKFKCQQSQENNDRESYVAWSEHIATCGKILSFLNTLEVKDPYEQCIQYPSIEDSIKAHAETYSFNIESELFNQLTKEQQALWRKEIEQACISGGEAGVELARDTRYKENVEDLETDVEREYVKCYIDIFDKKFPIMPTLKGQYLHDYKNFLNRCQQIFGLKWWGMHPTQAILFEKLSLLWATWGAEHLQIGQAHGEFDTPKFN